MAEQDGSTPTSPADDAHPGYDRVAARETVVMYNALAYVLAGPLTFGPVGWGLDHLLGTSFLLPLGILAGMALSLYLVWFRYGSQ
jgi:hypothetical protein